MIRIGKCEKEFIEEGVKENIRSDGRKRLDFRPFILNTGVITQANGSSRIKLADTDILIGIKAEIGEPTIENPDSGRIEVHVDCSPSADPTFVGRGGDSLSSSLSSLLLNILQKSGCINWKSLCISEGKQCWVLFLDALILDSDGNLNDALAIGAFSALQTCHIPKIQIVKLENGLTEIDFSDDPSDFEKLPIKNIPICITFAKIGDYFVVDPTVEEELVMTTKLTIAINEKSEICLIQKGGSSSGLNPSELTKMIQVNQHSSNFPQSLQKKLD